MPKGWAALPRSVRWLAGGIAAVVLTLAVVWVLFVPAADWLAHHDVGSVTGSLHETAVDNARGRLLTLGAGLFAAGALVFTARNFTLSRRTFELAEQGQVTGRYTKAIGQLGTRENLGVRIGGIYALERIASDSPRDHPTVMEVLAAFIREHSHKKLPGPEPPVRQLRPDVQAALTVILRRNPAHDRRAIDLTAANLAYADLRGASFAGVLLARVNLTRADLSGADLSGTDLQRATIDDADLTGANLSGADLRSVTLTSANLTGANLSDADLRSATLGPAFLVRAFLVRANLIGANLTGADLRGADLTGATLIDADFGLFPAIFTRASLQDARWPAGEPVPEGWTADPGSGLLKWSRAGSPSA